MNNIAKEIFFRYNGSHSLMKNDGVYEKYKTYAVSAQEEKQWLQEIEIRQTKALNDSENIKFEYVKLCMTVRKTKNIGQIDSLFDVLSSKKTASLDALSRLYMIETFTDLLRTFQSEVVISKYLIPLRKMISDIQVHNSTAEASRRSSVMLAQIADL